MNSRAGMLAPVVVVQLLLATPTLAADREPAVGMFLVASEDLRDPNFAETVVLLVEHGAGGTLGLVVNRPAGIQPGVLLPDIEGLAGYRASLFVGGPVARLGVLMLIRSGEPLEGAEPVFDDVHVSGDPELLDSLAGQTESPLRLRVYAGHAGWSGGQLEREISRGSWYLTPANADAIFGDDPETLWRQLLPGPEAIEVKSRQPLEINDVYQLLVSRRPERGSH